MVAEKEKQYSTKDIYLLRHGETGFSGRYLGATDIGLSQEGRDTVGELRLDLLKNKFQKIYTSPLKRCLETCSLLGIADQAEKESDLREINFGLWEKLSFQEVSKHYPEDTQKWVTDPLGFTFPGGESMADFYSRIRAAARNLAAADHAGPVLAVCHGGVIRHLLCHFLGLSMENYLIFDVRCGSYSAVRIFNGGTGILTAMNHGGS